MAVVSSELETSHYLLYEKIIPLIQEHVSATGHIWNQSSSCHDCLSYIQAYKNARYSLDLSGLKEKGLSTFSARQILAIRSDVDSEFRRLVGD
ncbi:MAG TPA: hypothetical protein VF828_03945 [Patescibacteria group bacterium]